MWCGQALHLTRRDCPVANALAMGVKNEATGKKRAAPFNFHSMLKNYQNLPMTKQQILRVNRSNLHEGLHVQSALKGIFVDLVLSATSSSPPSKPLCFQVDSGSSCNTIRVSDLNKLQPVKIRTSAIPLQYSKSVNLELKVRPPYIVVAKVGSFI